VHGVYYTRGGTKIGYTIYKHREYTENNDNTAVELATGAECLIISKVTEMKMEGRERERRGSRNCGSTKDATTTTNVLLK